MLYYVIAKNGNFQSVVVLHEHSTVLSSCVFLKFLCSFSNPFAMFVLGFFSIMLLFGEGIIYSTFFYAVHSRRGDNYWVSSVLALWEFDGDIIKNLTTDDILAKLNEKPLIELVRGSLLLNTVHCSSTRLTTRRLTSSLCT